MPLPSQKGRAQNRCLILIKCPVGNSTTDQFFRCHCYSMFEISWQFVLLWFCAQRRLYQFQLSPMNSERLIASGIFGVTLRTIFKWAGILAFITNVITKEIFIAGLLSESFVFRISEIFISPFDGNTALFMSPSVHHRSLKWLFVLGKS